MTSSSPLTGWSQVASGQPALLVLKRSTEFQQPHNQCWVLAGLSALVEKMFFFLTSVFVLTTVWFFFCQQCLSTCANLQKILRGPNQFKPEFRMCIPGMIVSVAMKGVLDLEANLETIQNRKKFWDMSNLKQPTSVCNHVQKWNE